MFGSIANKMITEQRIFRNKSRNNASMDGSGVSNDLVRVQGVLHRSLQLATPVDVEFEGTELGAVEDVYRADSVADTSVICVRISSTF